MNLVCGIDPGINGGITIIDACDKAIIYKGVMPIFKLKTSKKQQSEYDLESIKKIFQCLTDNGCGLAVLETQQAMPKQGVSSTFKTGRGFGLLEGLLFGMGISYILIKPRDWQTEIFKGLPKDDTKKLSIMVSQRLFPGIDLKKNDRCTVSHDGIADSLMIAEFGRRKFI
jgi:crossover junction endodeoxyribonuclease RuvC